MKPKPPKDPILSILPAKKSDLKVVWAMERKLHAFHKTKSKRDMPCYMEEVFSGPHAHAKAWLAYVGGVAAGFVLTLDWFRFHTHERIAFIKSLYIEKPYRGMGIGPCLIAVAAREALARKCTGMTIGARTENKIANDLYQSLGFKKPKPRAQEGTQYAADLKTMKKLTGKPNKKTR